MTVSPERQAIVAAAESLLGYPARKYVYNSPDEGTLPEQGLDCSGFVRYVLTRSGLHIPPHLGHDGIIRPTRHANELWDTYGISVHKEYVIPGDLVFFSREGWWPTHVGIVNGEDTYIHSPGKDNARIREDSFSKDGQPIVRPSGTHRRLYYVNPIGFKSPVVAHTPSYRISQRPLD